MKDKYNPSPNATPEARAVVALLRSTEYAREAESDSGAYREILDVSLRVLDELSNDRDRIQASNLLRRLLHEPQAAMILRDIKRGIASVGSS